MTLLLVVMPLAAPKLCVVCCHTTYKSHVDACKVDFKANLLLKMLILCTTRSLFVLIHDSTCLRPFFSG